MKEELTPEEALRRIGEVGRRTRRPARVVGLLYAVVGLSTVVYWPVMFLGPAWSRLVAGVAWVVLTVLFVGYLGGMRVQDPEVTWANKTKGPVTISYVVLVLVVFVFGTFLLPGEPSTGWSAALIALAVCASVPPFYAAWRVLRAER
ncbi:hypothetical protein OG339_35070 [Streptosporangium sp. NBC_01495]|uniref:hypothetical protein n=1 Tax=Streptosporangium sp. NBC_01495 TaxID=2903899 RepID=UPI002E3145CF|nr:hypothetical protein [Streptosporangium sp. NBC_01495]